MELAMPMKLALRFVLIAIFGRKLSKPASRRKWFVKSATTQQGIAKNTWMIVLKIDSRIIGFLLMILT